LSTSVKQQIQSEDLYGNDSHAVTEQSDVSLANFQRSDQSNSIAQFTPTGQGQTFEVAQYSSSVVPWTYIIFKPLSLVTGLADQQLLSIFLIVALVLVITVFSGLLIGRRLALPILYSVSLLRKSNISLKELADEESAIATEQNWMVEAAQTALKSVQYYTNATAVAANRISKLSNDITPITLNQDPNRYNQSLQEMVETAAYIERALKHQETMNEKLAMSLRVTTQATEQLTKGANATNDAAAQMEYIVGELTSVVGES
jgi:methyl-accepting chemotaxis protein